ncbi:MAG: BspA family leucine-rich repeat surface protein, partial [Bacilli bacterium]|nr:BspA family leucine-rich repeat surface protein [Bacilli bacterium]
SSVQTFAGWTASNLNTTTALYGSTSNPTTTWNGTTKVGASEATTYFKNLRDSSGTVTLIANWTAVAVTLPKIEKTGYACGYAISAGGAIVYQSEGSYTPSVTTESDTLYARCEVRMLMQHNSTTSQTFGKSISRDSFESITTLNSKTVPGNAIDSWDVSSEQNGSVMSWYTDTDSDGKYELYIGQDGGVKANTDSSYAFYSFQNLDSIDLTYFDTSSVTNMSQMFSSTGRNSTVFTLDLGDNFDTSSVTNMNGMFRETGYSSTVFTLDLGDNFDTSNVTNMVSMFSYTGRSSTVFTLDLGDNFDTSNVTNMNSMFNQTGYSSTVFTLDLGDKFDTSNVTSINQMFNQTGYSSTEFTLDLGDKFDTSNVIDMYQMFNQTGYSSTVFTLDLGDNFDTSGVTDMSHMFNKTGYNSTVFTLDLGDNFNTSNVTNMSNMFNQTGYSSTVFTLDLGDNFDTSNVTNMGSMFSYTGYNSTEFTLDLGDNFDTSSVTMMDSMFCSTGRSSTVFTLDLGDRFDTSNVTNMLRMFNQTGRNSTVFTLDLGDNFDTSNVTNMSYMFRETGYSSTVFTLDLGDNFDTSNVTDMSSMFYYTGRSSTVFTLDLGDNFDTSNVTNMSSMFYYTGYSNTVFTLDLRDKFDTSSVTNMFSMFYYTGYSNTTFEIDIMQFDFSNVTTYNDIFTGWRTTNTIWVKDAADQSWVITNSANSNLTTSNVLYPNFATDTWERIVANIESGNTDNYHVGDTKEVDLGSLGTHTLRIANMSTPDACSGSTYSQTACGFVLEFADLLGTRAMHSSATNVGGWPGTTMRTYVNSTVYDALPEALRRGIIDTKTISGHGSTSGESNWTSTDKLYLLSMVEVYGANYTNDSLQTTQTRQLDYYSQIGVTTSSYAGAIKNNGTTATAWRLRSAGSNNTTYYNYINASGNRANASATTAYGVSPAFRIGAHPFETDSWETIVTNVQNGNTGNYYVGDTKEVNLGALGVHTLRLINKATPSACSSTPSYSETACGFVVEFSDIITTNSMNTTDTNVGGWPASSLRTYINNDIYNALPSALKNGIINTTVVSSHENGVSNNYVSTDKLYLLSYVEIYGSDYTNDSLKTTQTRQMDYYSREAVTSSSYAKVIKQNSGTDSVWWLRPASTASSNFFIVDTVGKWGGSSATTANGVSPAFRIGASSFKTDTWETIIENVQLGNTDNYNVGDTKRVDLGSLGLH